MDALLHGTKPDPNAFYTPAQKKQIEDAQLKYLSAHENASSPEDLTNLIVGLSGAGEVASLVKGIGQVGVRELGAAAVKQAAGSAEANALVRTLTGVGRKGVVRQLAKGAAEKAEPAAVRAGRQAIGRRVGQAAEHVPSPLRTAGSLGGRAAATPFKHPFTSALALQAPSAAIHGDPGQFTKALEGKGTLAAIGSAAGNLAAGAVPGKVAQNLVKDAFNLPAVALPSAYMPIAGAVEAAKGDPSRLEGLLNSYARTGLLPAVFRGEPKAALHALENHPLYSALEISGAAAVAGRGAGALVRGGTGGRLAGTERPALVIRGLEKYGDVRPVAGRLGSGGSRYSPDLFRQLLQRASDSRRVRKQGGHYATATEARRAINASGDRFAYERDQVRRLHKNEAVGLIHEARPKSGRLKTDHASAGVVSLAVQRIIRDPSTFHEDLRTYRAQLEDAYKSGKLTRSEKAANRDLVKTIDRGIEGGNPEAVVRAANAFVEHHGALVDELVSHGLLDKAQAEKASAIPFARVHMGADYHPEHGVVDAHGNPLSLDAIKAEMQRHGVEAPGFLTHRARTNSAGGAWYRALFPERQSLPKQARTGAAVAHGTYDASYRALVEQAARSQSIVDATGGFDGMIRQFGLPAPHGVTNMSQAHDALLNPDRYGFTPPPDVPLRPIRVAPFLALKRELEAAHEHQGLLNPENSPVLENVASQTLAEATRDGAGPVAYVPEALFKRMQEHFRTTASYEKAAQAANTAFKGAVLPFSPSFYIGNAVDNWIRFALGGHGPSDIMLGRKISKQLPEGARESIIPGAGYGSFKRVQTYRDARQFEGTPLARVASTLHAVRETPGPKQAVNLFDATRDFLLETNSKLFERLPQYGALGKEARRDLQASSGHWHHALMVSDDAMKDLLKGLRNTDKQIQYAKAVEEVFGNWGKNSPFSRHVLTNLVPFWMWARASTRFVLLTLPAHHPIKVGLLAAAAEMTEDERKKFGLDKFAEEAVPGFLQGNVPLGPGITRNLSKYTSFGTFSDYPEFLGRMFFAQGSSPLQSLQGLDWKGDKLAKADGSPASDEERVKAALLTMGEQFVPGFNLIQGLSEPSKFSPLATESGEKLDYLRKLSNSQQITVPATGSGGGSSSGPGSFTGGYLEHLSGGTGDFTEGYLQELGR
jgi:hypothetical protein